MQSFPLSPPSTCLPNPQVYLKKNNTKPGYSEENGKGKYVLFIYHF